MLMHRLRFHRPSRTIALVTAMAIAVFALFLSGGITALHAQSASPQASSAPAAFQDGCGKESCAFHLRVNPKLLPDPTHPFACPAIQHAQARIVIDTDRHNDTMVVTANGLPKNTAFDVFLVQNSPLDQGTFPGFGFGWYQSDLLSDSYGHASVKVQGIFDKETFIENPASASPIHTFNVGFWFDSPTQEQQVCGNASAPAAGPFNGEQQSGLLAMITQGEPLQLVP